MTDPQNHRIQIAEIQLLKNKNGTYSETGDMVAVESPLQISIGKKPLSITMRTPGDDKALSIGFLFTEGLITGAGDILNLSDKMENEISIDLSDDLKIDSSKLERNFYTTSSCGVCGKSSVDAITTRSAYNIALDDVTLVAETLFLLPDKLMNVQSVFEATGGLHAAALFNEDGRFLHHSEDVGRHNALDKLIGHALLAGRLPLVRHVLLLSGRASFELIQKASMAGIPIVVAVGAPSSLAIELAQKQGQTLVGFLKKTGFNVYSHPERIIK